MSTTVEPGTQEHPATGTAPAADGAQPTSCPNCGAPADPGQLMCLECGSRLALDYQRPPSWRLPAAIVAIVVLVAGAGLAYALARVSHDAGKTTASAPTQSVPGNVPADTASPTQPAAAPTASAPTPSTPTPAPASGGAPSTGTTTTPATTATTPAPGAWPAGKSAYTVILASMPNKADAEAKLKAARTAGIGGAAILHSDDFPTLRRGYWVVFDGQYDSTDQAAQQAKQDRGKGFADAYPRFVSANKNAKP